MLRLYKPSWCTSNATVPRVLVDTAIPNRTQPASRGRTEAPSRERVSGTAGMFPRSSRGGREDDEYSPSDPTHHHSHDRRCRSGLSCPVRLMILLPGTAP